MSLVGEAESLLDIRSPVGDEVGGEFVALSSGRGTASEGASPGARCAWGGCDSLGTGLRVLPCGQTRVPSQGWDRSNTLQSGRGGFLTSWAHLPTPS